MSRTVKYVKVDSSWKMFWQQMILEFLVRDKTSRAVQSISVNVRSVFLDYRLNRSGWGITPKRTIKENEMLIDIYTDGACSGNPGPGGWGALLIYGDLEKEICGGEPETTTNNRMEITAAIEALERLAGRSPL